MSNVDDSKALTLERLRQFTNLLDNAVAIPGTNYRVGIDPLLGLIPGGGDTLGAVLSGYIVLQAARLGAPKATLARMVFNILFDSLLGAVPVLGDLFDVAWKANTMNLAMLETHLRSPHQRKHTDEWFAILLLAGLLIVVIAISLLGILIMRELVRLFTGI
jgi:Domain of unknown function (DUF4112)